MRTHLVQVFGLVLPLVGCSDVGEATACNTMDAPSGVTVRLDTTGWPAGEPLVSFDLDGEVVHCELVSAPSERFWECGTPTFNHFDDEDIVRFFLADHTPAEVIAEITVDRVLIDTVSGTPTYRFDEPNGEGCGERKKATLDL